MLERHTNTQVENPAPIYDLVPNASLRDFLQQIDKVLPPEQKLFYASNLKLLSSCVIHFGDKDIRFHHSVLTTLEERLRHKKVVPYITLYEGNRPRIKYSREGVYTISTLHWTQQTIVPNKRGDLRNVAEIERRAKEELGKSPLTAFILPPDEKRQFPVIKPEESEI